MPTLEQRADLDFVLVARRAWAARVYPALADSVRAAAETAAAPAERDGWAEAVTRITPVVHAQPVYPFFAFLERGLQKQLWRAVTEVVESGAAEAGQHTRESACAGPGTLELDPALELPDWYAECDFHLQPGGVWPGITNGLVYKLGARVVMLGANDAAAFHWLFTRTAVPVRAYQRIVDLGCGFGKSTFPFKEAFPSAEVIGVDVAAPLLELAHSDAAAHGLDIRFRQASCAATGLETGSADLVTATMLLHELPPPVVRGTLAEAARLLQPGGLLRILDFQPTGDPVRDLAMVEHSARNNEPFMAELFRSDVVGWCTEVGLCSARWLPFDERGAGLLPGPGWPQRAEWHFPWAVLEAERR
jgi:SAM-dependent methyltransferase